MTRGTNLRLLRKEAIARALSHLVLIPDPPPNSPADAGGRPVNYRLSTANGDLDPRAAHCASWSFGNRVPTSDCIGFLLFSAGIDRCQPDYDGVRDIWLNCESLLSDAFGSGLKEMLKLNGLTIEPLKKTTKGWRFCRPLHEHERALAGDWVLTDTHCAMLLRAGGGPDDLDPLVIDCSPRHGRKTAVGIGGYWSESCVVLRPLIYSGE